jgi:hypothetical protein
MGQQVGASNSVCEESWFGDYTMRACCCCSHLEIWHSEGRGTQALFSLRSLWGTTTRQEPQLLLPSHQCLASSPALGMTQEYYWVHFSLFLQPLHVIQYEIQIEWLEVTNTVIAPQTKETVPLELKSVPRCVWPQILALLPSTGTSRRKEWTLKQSS